MSFQAPVVFVPSAARTTTGNTGPIAFADLGGQISILVNVTAIGGTPNMVLQVQWSHDGGASWAPADTSDDFTAITATKVTIKTYPTRGPLFRLVWTITGTTPSLTFSASYYVAS